MSLTLEHITVDSQDAAALAAFWAEALGGSVAPDASAEIALVGGPARPRDAPGRLFLRVQEGRVTNRAHLEAETERLVGLGARVLHEEPEWGGHWRTLIDPEGNEFCVAQRADGGA